MAIEKPKTWYGITVRGEPQKIYIVAARSLEWVKENCMPLAPGRKIRRLTFTEIQNYLGNSKLSGREENGFAVGSLYYPAGDWVTVLIP